jgi:stage III sporulation protein AE
MMHFSLCLTLLIALSTVTAVPAPSTAREAVDRVVQAEYEALDTSVLQRFLGGLDAEIRPYLPDFKPTATGTGKFDPAAFARQLFGKLLRELRLNAHLLGELVLLAVVCALLAHLGNSFTGRNVGQLAFYVCYLVMIGIVVKSFLTTVKIGQSTVDDLVSFMYALLPVVGSLMTSVGAVATSALFHPVILGAVATIGHLVRGIVFPLAILTAAVTLVSHLSEGFPLTKLAALLRDVTIGLTGILLAGFVGLIGIKGVAAAVADGVGMRAAKYVSGTFVPVVGKGISDALETVAGCSLLLKNSLGAFGAWSLIALTAFPLIKILALAAIYRLAAALIQPLGDNRLVEMLNAIGGSFTVLFAVTALVGLAFFIGLTILVALGNLTYALR